ncbi:ABC transporter ATP-binding protein [Nibricoccus sp. IMCC34717]|uniref:ABC transporter ATP-binding protein n=1 Tax=Nibricoccus sp. IMCC34717 TaxID=3034021 RepID=UPI003851428C
MPFLELSHVSKGFGGPPILSDINLTIEKGEFVAIVGYSGSGKTTLISLIAGLQKPDTGTIRLNDLDITGPGPDRGIVFQNYSLLPWLTVTENITLAVEQVFPNWSEAKRTEHVERHIQMVNLTPHAQKLPRQLSGGQRQRVSVARALAMDPQILLLDEPLSALDALTRGTLQDEIEHIWESNKKTVVLITNDVDEALLLADRIIPLTPGPGATLGPQTINTLARPRDRKSLNHDPEFKRLRSHVTRQLLDFRDRGTTRLSKRLTLPDILPEDLEKPRTRRTRPLRPSEIKNEEISVSR